MCILPNFAVKDLAEVSQKGKNEKRKAQTQTVNIVIAENPLIEI